MIEACGVGALIFGLVIAYAIILYNPNDDEP